MKVIIIGGVAAGMSAASKIARKDSTAEIVVYEKGGFLSYGACGLPYYVGDFNDDSPTAQELSMLKRLDPKDYRNIEF